MKLVVLVVESSFSQLFLLLRAFYINLYTFGTPHKYIEMPLSRWPTCASFLAIETIPGDGNCMFNAIARGLHQGGVTFFPNTNIVIHTKSLRKYLADRITPEMVALLLNTYGSIQSVDNWLSHVSVDAPVESVRKIVEQSSPVIYQGDDWSLGILAEILHIHFIIMRNDGKFQAGMPNISDRKRPILILYFQDFENDGKTPPTGATVGHYNLVKTKSTSQTLFTWDTLPICILKAFTLQFPKMAPPDDPLPKQPLPDTPLPKQTQPPPRGIVPPSKEAPPTILYPMNTAIKEPEIPMTLIDLFVKSIKTMPQRHQRKFTKSSTLIQKYELNFTQIDATVIVSMHVSPIGFLTYKAVVTIHDAIMGDEQSIIHDIDNMDVFVQKINAKFENETCVGIKVALGIHPNSMSAMTTIQKIDY
jgi:hypothetical protein